MGFPDLNEEAINVQPLSTNLFSDSFPDVDNIVYANRDFFEVLVSRHDGLEYHGNTSGASKSGSKSDILEFLRFRKVGDRNRGVNVCERDLVSNPAQDKSKRTRKKRH